MKRFILIGCLFAMSGCQKVVDLNLRSTKPWLVIEGNVTDLPGPYTVSIRTTVDFDAENIFPGISGASVKISDNEGVTDSLTESSAGIYTTHILQGKPGNTYTLKALVHDTLYTAVSSMPQPVTFDSIHFNLNAILGKDRISAAPCFQDPAGEKNYYQFLEFINGKQLTKDIFVFDDRLSDGRYISRNLRNDSTYIQPGDSIEVRMFCIDKPIYDYFFQLDQSSGNSAMNTTASPSNPVSNIDNGALGYFSAHTWRSMRAKSPAK